MYHQRFSQRLTTILPYRSPETVSSCFHRSSFTVTSYCERASMKQTEHLDNVDVSASWCRNLLRFLKGVEKKCFYCPPGVFFFLSFFLIKPSFVPKITKLFLHTITTEGKCVSVRPCLAEFPPSSQNKKNKIK